MDIFFGGDFDLGFDCGWPRPDGIEAVLVLQSVMTPVCAPQVLERIPLRKPSDLAAHNLLHTTPDRHDWEVWLRTYKVEGVDAKQGELFPSGDMAFRAAALGQGVVMGDMAVLRDEIESGQLIPPLRDHEIREPSEAYHLFGAASCWNDPDVHTFRKWVLESAAIER
jgi:LysR family transcriptional regulator, glycine cleavage system transcriptional activator